MCVPTFDASDRQRGGQRTARRVDYTARCAPHDGVDDIPRHNSSQPCTVDTWRRACLEKTRSQPQRPAHGRRPPQGQGSSALSKPQRPIYIHIYIHAYDYTRLRLPTPTTTHTTIYIYIYIYTYTHTPLSLSIYIYIYR